MQSEAGEKLVVQFHMGTIEDVKASTEKGYKVFKDVPWVRIIVPGEHDVYDQPAWIDDSDVAPHQMAHNIRFPAQWLRFKAGQSQETVGFPLAEWPLIMRSQVESLIPLKIKTVEQLAGVSDGALQHMGPGYLSLRQKAQEWLKRAKENAPMERITSELATRDSEIAVLKAQMAELLAAKGQSLSPAPATVAPPAKKRGRPAKAKQPEATTEG